ncbi:hypothetical protein SVIOM342S_08594 [Streptomyces violaceorubidus]
MKVSFGQGEYAIRRGSVVMSVMWVPTREGGVELPEASVSAASASPMRQAARSRGPTGLETARSSSTGTPCAAAASATPKPSIASARAPGWRSRSSAARSAVPVTVEPVRTVPGRAPVAPATARTRPGRRQVGDAAEAEVGDRQEAVGGLGTQVGRGDRVGDDERADGRVGDEAAADAGRDDQVVGRAFEGRRGQGGGRGGGGEGRSDPGGQQVPAVRQPVQDHPRTGDLGARRRERPSHRVPFGGDRGGHEEVHGGRGRQSFFSLKTHTPVMFWLSSLPSRAATATFVELPWAPYCALNNTLPGTVR